MKKAIYFTMDAFFAALLIGMGIILASKYAIYEETAHQESYFSSDIIASLSAIMISEIDDPYVQSLILSGEIYNLNNTVIEQIGEFYVLNKTELAMNLSKIVSTRIIPDKFGFQILINQENIYFDDSQESRKSELTSSKRLISGMEKFKPLKGATSKVFLEGIRNKKYSNYLYFGGFVGQGNITANLTEISTDANITSVELELDAGSEFTLFINNVQCGAMFIPASNLTIADRWNLTACSNLLNKGEQNRIDIKFDGPLNNSYLAGGFLKVDYGTREISKYFEGYKITYNFPGIDGIANLYDGFYVPGTIESMNIYLHFKSNETTYLTLGSNTIIELKGNNTEQSITLTDENLTSFPISISYNGFSNTTVPLRLASYELMMETTMGNNADIVLITDLSGSMKCRMGDWSCPPVGNAIPQCKESDLIDPDSRRLGISGCLDGFFNDIVMNESLPVGNRLWLVDFSDDANPFYTSVLSDLTHDNIDQEITDRYKSKSQQEIQGGTCIACAINQAYNIFNTYSSNNRTKALLVMSDGIPVYCTGGYWSGGQWRCNETSTGLNGGYLPWNCVGDESNCENSYCNGPINNTINAAKRIHDDLNVTVYAVGMGPLGSCERANYTLTEIAKAGNGSVYISTDGSFLSTIYREIASEILSRVTQSSQVVQTKGNISRSILYSDSYIKINYTPIAEKPAFDEIAVNIEEDKFSNCTPSFYIYPNLRVTDAKVTSYSGQHWTDSLLVNDVEVYNLTHFSSDYVRLGDPFFVYVPVNRILNGTNTLQVLTGDSPENTTGCSPNNTIIYTALIKSSVSYANVLPRAEGCIWEIDFDDGSSTVIKVPQDYSGVKQCYYTSALIDYDVNDSFDAATYQLFRNLDYNDNGRLFVNIDEYNLIINAISVQKIPYPWGPAIAEVRVWK